MACKRAKEAWDRLKEEYQGSDRTRQMQVLNLKREFQSLNMQEDETISELMSALQAQEQRSTMRWDKFTEGAFSVQKQIFGKGKQQFNQKNTDKHGGGNNSGDVKQKFPPCKHCKRTTHLEKYCWWRVNAIFSNCKQTGTYPRSAGQEQRPLISENNNSRIGNCRNNSLALLWY
ncbi:hypothetical protein KY284_032644 [Solanum tuberosum]|nr:hypothetical protein KY284_032644 [Solanum tuberosum]